MRNAAMPILFVLACAGCGSSTPAQSTAKPAVPTSQPSATSAPAPTISDAGVSDAQAPAATGPRALDVKSIALAGATDSASLDYIAQRDGRVWLPFVSGTSGGIAVFDIASGTFAQVGGLKTAEREAHGKMRSFGPSSVTLGDGVAYFGNRGTSEVCVANVAKLSIGKCLKLASPPDGVVYVASAHEVWVTTPQARSLTILDASVKDTLKAKETIKLFGEPEGYAVDDTRGVFYTNLEDKNQTLSIDVKSRRNIAPWTTGCGPDGPRGLALDVARQLLIVACTDHLQALSTARGGALLGKLDTGEGVDNIDLQNGIVYAAAGRAGRLTIAKLDDQGNFSVIASGATAEGARNAVADGNGSAYVVDGRTAHLLIAKPAP